MPIFYKAERFFPTEEYENFTKIKGIKEIISYDMSLCSIIYEEDLSGESEYIGEVTEWKSLLQMPVESDEQIIAYYENPIESHEFHRPDECFEFCGYDLSEKETGISAITNCGDYFDKVIPYDKLNKYGLLDDYNEAVHIQKLLESTYPNESHAQCELYELWRRI